MSCVLCVMCVLITIHCLVYCIPTCACPITKNELNFMCLTFIGVSLSFAVTALVPYDFLTRMFALGAPFMGDFSNNNKVHTYRYLALLLVV